jgi:hypothetical protein
LDKKDLLIQSEIRILSFFNFELSKYKCSQYYSLMLSLCCILGFTNNAVQLAWTLINQIFLSEDVGIEDFPDIVASPVDVTVSLIKKYGESFSTGQETNETFEKILSIENKWFIEHKFNNSIVTKGNSILLKALNEDLQTTN